VKALEKKITIVYIAKKNDKKTSRKDLGAVYYIIDEFLENGSASDYKIYPDGVYSTNLDRLIDYLIYLGLLDIENEQLKLTDTGLNLAKKIYIDLKENIELKAIEILFSYKLKTIWKLAYNLANPSSSDELSYEVIDLLKKLSALKMGSESKQVLRGIKR